MKCVVVGGGFAGLAAAAQLVSEGVEVTLVEERPHLGGRAWSFVDETTGDTIDNGPHLFLGCYRSTRAFLARIGASGKIDFSSDLALTWLSRGRRFRFAPPSAKSLPPALGLLAGLARFEALSFTERALALRVPAAMKAEGKLGAPPGDRETVDEWLRRLSQSPGACRAFWHPIAIAALNEDPRTASAKMFEAALRETFLGDRDDARLAVSTVGLSDLYCGDAERFLIGRGATVRLATPVRELLLDGASSEGSGGPRRVRGVLLSDGERIEADTVIVAVPPRQLLDLVPAELHHERGFAGVARLTTSPIISIHLWFDRIVTDEPLFGLLDSKIHWVWNRNRLGRVVDPSRSHLSIVISAARSLVDLPANELVDLASAELRRELPASGAAKLVHSRVIKERDATISHTAGADLDRPRARTSIGGLFLAGDWVRTGLPATVESAVRSAEDAALLALTFEPPPPPQPSAGFVPLGNLKRRAVKPSA